MIFLTETIRLRNAGNGSTKQGYIILPAKKFKELAISKPVNADVLIFKDGELAKVDVDVLVKKIKEKIELDKEIEKLMNVGLNLELDNPHNGDK